MVPGWADHPSLLVQQYSECATLRIAADQAASYVEFAAMARKPTGTTGAKPLDEARRAARLAARPPIAYDEALPVNARRAEIAARHPAASGRRRLRRDRFGQDHAIAEDLPGTRPRHATA